MEKTTINKIINDKALQEKTGFKPHKYQEQILEAYNKPEIREICISAGRRSGKSILVGYILLRELFSSNKNCLVLSPSYDLTNRVLDYVSEWLRKMGSSCKIQSKPHPLITNPLRKSRIWGKSSEEVKGILGQEYDLVIVDEAGLVERDVIETYLVPAVSSRKGKIVLIGTPRGKNKFFEMFMEAKDSKEGASFSFSSNANPFFPSGEWERAKKKLPTAIFQREFEAQFSDDTTSIFKGVSDLVNINLPREAIPGHQHVLGLDLAKEEDYTALTIIDKNTFPFEVVYSDRWNKIPYPAQIEKIIGVAKRYPGRVTIDSRNIGAVLGGSLRSSGLWVDDFCSVGTISKDWKKKGSKEKLVEHAISFFESKVIMLPDYSSLIDEITSYGYQITDSGNVRYGAPKNYHDDLVDSLMLALWSLKLPNAPVKTRLQSELMAGAEWQSRVKRSKFQYK